MNYLAHALLAGDHPADRIGGVIGDFVKGPLDPLPAGLGLGPGLAAGVMLHRRIDSFADTHPAFLRSRGRVSAARRRVAGVMVDMFYDHFLARHWAQFSEQALGDFTADTYRMIAAHPEPLPPSFGPVFERMRAHDWLASYRDVAVVALALDRMAEFRLRRPNPLATYAGLEADFLDFLPDARAFALSVVRQRGG